MFCKSYLASELKDDTNAQADLIKKSREISLN